MSDRSDLTELQAKMALANNTDLYINWPLIIIACIIVAPFVLPTQITVGIGFVLFCVVYGVLQFLCSPLGLLVLAAMCGVPVVVAICI